MDDPFGILLHMSHHH